MIYDDKICINLPIQSYIMFNYSMNDIINLTIIRKKTNMNIDYRLKYYNDYICIKYIYNNYNYNSYNLN